jgi:peptidoglycan L-alanyl-D-glutamate endopeptidase CwlK
VAGESTIRDESTTTGALAGATVETLDATATQSLLFAAALPARTVTPGSSGIGESASIPSPATPDLDQLNPAFRTKLERVIQRMESEFGYRVEIVELVRSQSRQDALFESGRTRPGPVVTWTRASRHSEGRAADLRIDGSYQNSAVYQRLWQVARSEGLVTLGPQDAGHVELPGPSTQSPSAQRMTATNGAGTSWPDVSLRMVRVATVAGVANVATVATVATPGSVSPSTPSSKPVNVQAFPATAATVAGMNRNAGIDVSSGNTDGTTSHDGATGSGAGGRDDAAPAPLPFSFPVLDIGTEGVGRPAAPNGTFSAEQVLRLMERRDAAAERPLTSLLLRLDHPSGGEDRVRLDARGGLISAAIETSDHQMAEDLGRRVAELASAMQQNGLEPELLSIRSTSREAAALRGAAAELELRRLANQSAGSGGPSTHRDPRGSLQKQDHPNGESPRERSRRGARGER